MRFRQILTVVLVFVIHFLSGQVVYDDASKLLPISNRVMIFEDEEHTFSKEEVLSMPNNKFLKTEGSSLNFKHTDSKFWIKFDLKNGRCVKSNAESSNESKYIIS